MKVIIAGTRWITDYALLERVIQCVIDKTGLVITEVVSGKADGPDTMGEEWAKQRGIPINDKPADWKKYGLAAGGIRNKEMGDYADVLIALWNDKSTGTKDMMDYMWKLNKQVYYHSPSHPDPVPQLFDFFD